MSKCLILLVKSFLGTFIAIWRLFTGRTASRTFALDFPPKFSFPWSAAILDKLYIPILGILSYLSSPHIGLVTKYTVLRLAQFLIIAFFSLRAVAGFELTALQSNDREAKTLPLHLNWLKSVLSILYHNTDDKVGRFVLAEEVILKLCLKQTQKIGSICMAIFQSCLTIWSIQLFISFYKRAPWLEH